MQIEVVYNKDDGKFWVIKQDPHTWDGGRKGYIAESWFTELNAAFEYKDYLENKEA